MCVQLCAACAVKILYVCVRESTSLKCRNIQKNHYLCVVKTKQSMSNNLIYVKLPLYEREWCEHHFGSPCEFPAKTNLNNIIRHFSRLRPYGVLPEVQQEGELAICLMGSKSKKPERYNYISRHGKAAIAEAIDDIFTMHMWEDLTDVGCRSVQLSKLVMDWMENNGISMTGNNYENLRMKFQRIKDTYRNKSGINISRGYKHDTT